jgi:hypothetical protein
MLHYRACTYSHTRNIVRIRQETTLSHPERVDYQTHPRHYRHWNLRFEGPVATLAADFDENAGLRPGYRLKLNSATTWAWTSNSTTRSSASASSIREVRCGGRDLGAQGQGCSARAPTSTCSVSLQLMHGR